MSNSKPFTILQKAFIEMGENRHKQLEEIITKAYGKANLKVQYKRHAYLAGGPGIGKTFAVNHLANKYKINLIKIQTIISMNALAVQLAVAAFMSPDKTIYVSIDDCDSIFMKAEGLSVMKGILDNDRNMFTWNKNLSSQIAGYEKSKHPEDKLKAEALRHFQPVGGVGVEIPTDNMRFIISSNRFLAPSNPLPNTQIKIDESAIRDRVDYKDCDFDKDEQWGWAAYITLKANIFNLSISQKRIILIWMYDNWLALPSVSMRAINDLAEDMVNYPEEYSDKWNQRLVPSHKRQ